MNYIKQNVAFFELQMTNQISVNAQAIYHLLFNINNKAGWIKKFRVSNAMLIAYTELSEQAIIRARNELINLGIIEYEKGNGRECGTYSLVRLYEESEGLNEAETESTCQPNVNQRDNQTVTLYKQNKTEHSVLPLQGGTVLITGQGTKILQAVWHS